MRAAVIDAQGIVANVIVVDDLSFDPGAGFLLVESDTANVGDVYQDGVFTTPEKPVPVPEEITMRQARLVLLGAGLLHVVDGALAGLPSPIKEAAQIEWEYSSTVKRSSSLIAQLGPALGLTQAQVDDLFRAGAAL